MTVRRLKTYTGSKGYVYQYYFVGQRPAAIMPEIPATEYIFDVTSDRKTTYAVSVFLPQQVVTAWNEIHGRSLKDSEQYAAAKLRLFRAFDELEGIPTRDAICRLTRNPLMVALDPRRRVTVGRIWAMVLQSVFWRSFGRWRANLQISPVLYACTCDPLFPRAFRAVHTIIS